MCVTPLKGFIRQNGYMVKVANSKAEFVRNENGTFITYYDMSLFNPETDLKDYIDIPCRSCEACYSDMRREWIARATAEMQLHDQAIFVTFTYRDYNDGETVLPPVAEMITNDGEILKHFTLRYRDFQLFMKRLRKCYPDRRLRYMVCGEYGSRTFRPHYHAIIYGIGLNDIPDLLPHNKNKHGDILYSSVYLDNLWTYGYTLIGEADNGTIAYVAGYVAKKFTTLKSKEWYEVSNVVAPFIRSSNKPGLGSEYIEAHFKDFTNEYDYKVLPALNSRSTPTTLYLTSNWRNKFNNHRFYSSDVADIIAYDDYKVLRRVALVDNRFKLLNTNITKEDYNSTLKNNFRKSCERKRGVY